MDGHVYSFTTVVGLSALSFVMGWAASLLAREIIRRDRDAH